MERILLDERNFQQVAELLREEDIYHIAGTSSLYVQGSKQKFLNARRCQMWPDRFGELVMMTPGEAARTELDREFWYVHRLGWLPKHIKLFDMRPPMYCGERVKEDDLTLVDLTGAYPAIYGRIWLDGPYPRGFGGLRLASVADALWKWKAARSGVMGVIRSRSVTAYRGSRRITLRPRNQYLSPHLWANTMSLLHQIANVAIELGAVYINTDGYIFRTQEGRYQEFQDLLRELGLGWRIKGQGEGEIRTWNAYKVGDRSTFLYEQHLPVDFRAINNLQEKDYGWFEWWGRCCAITNGVRTAFERRIISRWKDYHTQIVTRDKGPHGSDEGIPGDGKTKPEGDSAARGQGAD